VKEKLSKRAPLNLPNKFLYKRLWYNIYKNKKEQR